MPHTTTMTAGAHDQTAAIPTTIGPWSNQCPLGSEADMCSARAYVRFTPKADMCSAMVHVCFGPIADIDWAFGREAKGYHRTANIDRSVSHLTSGVPPQS